MTLLSLYCMLRYCVIQLRMAVQQERSSYTFTLRVSYWKKKSM